MVMCVTSNVYSISFILYLYKKRTLGSFLLNYFVIFFTYSAFWTGKIIRKVFPDLGDSYFPITGA